MCVFECLRDGGDPQWPSGPVAGGEGQDCLPQNWEKMRSSSLSHKEAVEGRAGAISGLLWCEQAAGPQWGASLGRSALTLCRQRRCYPRSVPTAGWGWQRGQVEEWDTLLLQGPGQARSERVKARAPRASGGMPGGPRSVGSSRARGWRPSEARRAVRLGLTQGESRPPGLALLLLGILVQGCWWIW